MKIISFYYQFKYLFIRNLFITSCVSEMMESWALPLIFQGWGRMCSWQTMSGVLRMTVEVGTKVRRAGNTACLLQELAGKGDFIRLDSRQSRQGLIQCPNPGCPGHLIKSSWIKNCGSKWLLGKNKLFRDQLFKRQ